MANFGIAFYWDSGEAGIRASVLIRDLSAVFPQKKVALVEVIRRVASAVLHLELDFSLYSQATLKDLEQRVVQSGGKLYEMMRMSEKDRDQFAKSFLRSQVGPPTVYTSYSEASKAVADHLTLLRQRQPAPRTVTPLGGKSGVEPRRITGEGLVMGPRPTTGEVRAVARDEVQLEIEFKSEAAFISEYQSNLSKGGVFVRTSARPMQNSFVALKLKLPNGRTIDTRARVVHAFDHPEHGGVGLSFEGSGPAFVAELATYLAAVSRQAG